MSSKWNKSKNNHKHYQKNNNKIGNQLKTPDNSHLTQTDNSHLTQTDNSHLTQTDNSHLTKKRFDLSDEQIKSITMIKNNKVNFISGTVSPAQSNKQKNPQPHDIEDMRIGMTYMLENYLGKSQESLRISIQPKFMGSRLQIYLSYEDPINRSYSVTRNGFRLTKSPELMKNVYQTMWNRLKQFMEKENTRMLILDGEIMPWSFLGQELIDNEFMTVNIGLGKEIELIEKYGFQKQLDSIKSQKNKYTETEMINQIMDINKMKEYHQVFDQQMKLYARPMEENEVPVYKAFTILKIIRMDGTESIPLIDRSYGQVEMYKIVSDPLDHGTEVDQLSLTITKENFDQQYMVARAYFDNLTVSKGFEGICIKPDYVKITGRESNVGSNVNSNKSNVDSNKSNVDSNKSNVDSNKSNVDSNKSNVDSNQSNVGSNQLKKVYGLAIMKVRSPTYLRIIYGYDMIDPSKLKRLVLTKTTSSKIKQSIREFEQGMKMLEITYDEIGSSKKMDNILAEFMFNLKQGEELDPRL